MRATTINTLKELERLFLFLSLSLLFIFVVAQSYRIASFRVQLNRFKEAREASSSFGAGFPTQARGQDSDFHLWSKRAIAAYNASLDRVAPPPLAVLRISSIQLEVPVMEGTEDFTLDRALGHIVGTPAPGQKGNVGIAGHRDSFFRPLKDIHIDDDVELLTSQTDTHYVVDETLIVAPEDVSVLRERSKASLTLVTCYPFDFVGSAPKRFIVHAFATVPAQHSFSAERKPDSENR